MVRTQLVLTGFNNAQIIASLPTRFISRLLNPWVWPYVSFDFTQLCPWRRSPSWFRKERQAAWTLAGDARTVTFARLLIFTSSPRIFCRKETLRSLAVTKNPSFQNCYFNPARYTLWLQLFLPSQPFLNYVKNSHRYDGVALLYNTRRKWSPDRKWSPNWTAHNPTRKRRMALSSYYYLFIYFYILLYIFNIQRWLKKCKEKMLTT